MANEAPGNATPVFCAIYRWRLHPGMEAQFVRAWSRVTQLLRSERGSLGSRLHRGPDDTWYSYTQWPSAQAKAEGLARPSVDPEAWQQLRDAIAESLPEIVLEPVADYLAPMPPIEGANARGASEDRADLPSAMDYAAERARFAPLEVVDLDRLQRAVDEPYRNQVVLDANDHCLRLSVFEGEYRWHFHPGTDELFLVLAGELHIEFEDRPEAVLGPLQCLVVPAGTIHRTRAAGRTVNATFERQGAETVFVAPVR